MSEIIVLNFTKSYEDQMREIFFESSAKKDFVSQEDKDSFYWKYAGYYLSHYPQYAWVAVRGESVLGYVLGMPQTQVPELYEIQPHLKPFEEYFKSYPAHLHINCHASSRGQGVGKLLVEKLLNQLRGEGVPGIHIMTGLKSKNKNFYHKLGFEFEVAIGMILLMGHKTE